MPSYKGHLAGGIVVYIALLCLLCSCIPSVVTAAEWLLFSLAGALFPDIDIKSRGQKYFYYLVFAFFGVLAFKGNFRALSCCSFIVITPMLTRHRGIFHSIWFIVAVPIVIWMAMSALFPTLSWPLFFDAIFFIAGALSHIMLDRFFSRLKMSR